MAKQTFTAGQVLTAAQVNNLQTDIFNQTTSTKTANYTLLVGDRGTRLIGNGTSITFTVDNSIFTAGDTIKLHNINSTVLTIAAGAGVTINAAAGLTIAQYQEATLFATSASSFILFESTASSANGLTLLNTTSFSGVTSQSFNNVFTSTYDNYKILAIITSSAANQEIQFRYRASAADSSTAVYNRMGTETNNNNTTISALNAAAQTSFLLALVNASFPNFTNLDLNIFSPVLTRTTGMQFQTSGLSAATLMVNRTGTGNFENTTTFDGFSLFSGSNFGGTVSIYGVSK
jgi:hypothetical protein